MSKKMRNENEKSILLLSYAGSPFFGKNRQRKNGQLTRQFNR